MLETPAGLPYQTSEERARIEADALRRKETKRLQNKRARSKDGSSNARKRDNYLKAIRVAGCVCVRCRQQFPPCAMDFHHREKGTKSFSLNMVGLDRPWELIEKELEKCELLCVVCHRIEHCDVEWRKTTAIYEEI